MASPYDGLKKEQLLEIQLNLVKILGGKRFSSQTVPGLNISRRIDSPAEVRTELALVQLAIDALDEDTAPPSRVYMKAT